MKKWLLCIIASITVFSGMRGCPYWEPIDDSGSMKCITITTLESNENVFKARITIHGYHDNAIDIDGNIYHQLSFDDPATFSYVGEPALPIISHYIALPKGENFEVNIVEEKWSEMILIGQVMPYQRSVLETEEEPPFEKDNIIYNKEVYPNDMVYIGDLQKWRGINNRILNICPIKYMPKEGKLSILKEFVLEILFDKTAKNNPIQSSNMHLFLNQINTTAGERIEEEIRTSAEYYDYLIIAGNIPGVLDCQALEDFRKWKAFKGYKTKLVSTNTIGTSASQIKQYIINESTKGIKYVLFIGDSDKIPLYYYENTALHATAKSDYWYGCLDGPNDLYADVFIGRFSTNNLSELTNMVNKAISYEKNPRNYGNKVLLVAHSEGAPGKYQQCSELIRTGNYSESALFSKEYGAPYYQQGNYATNDSVVSKINEGTNIINYRGHGDFNQWQTWNWYGQSFYDTQISSLNNLTNDIYFCVACLNGDIYDQTCFMETFIRSNYGAAGMLAATESTYTSVNDSYNQFLFSKLLNDKIYNIGDLNWAAHMATIATTTPTNDEQEIAKYNTFCYLCGGDPSLEIITNNTSEFDCVLSFVEEDFIIYTDNTGKYKVSLVNEDGTLSSVLYTTGSYCVLPTPTNNCYISLNKHNFVPRSFYINATDNIIQNKVFNNTNIDNYYINTNNLGINVGYDVTNSMPHGNVTIESGNKLVINMSNNVSIKNGFECKLGGELVIKTVLEYWDY